MGTTFERGSKQTCELVAEVMAKYHGGLNDAEVTVDVLIAHASRDKNGDPTGPAIKHGTYPCKAKIRVTSLAERAFERGDAEMTLDGDHIDEWSEEELLAVIDHELSHLEFTGERDDLDRPKLKTVPHDVQFGWFHGVARRHGENSTEVQQASSLLNDNETRQLYLFDLVTEEVA